MKYILANPGKFNSFLFESSRVGAIHTDKINGEKCYNMTLSTGLPGWHLVIFTNPMNHIAYKLSVEKNDYFAFLEGLAEISDFWNFSSLNDITMNNANYLEVSHYRAKVGDLMIDIMCNGKSYPELQAQGFGVKVTRENAKDFISMLRRQVEDYEQSHQ